MSCIWMTFFSLWEKWCNRHLTDCHMTPLYLPTCKFPVGLYGVLHERDGRMLLQDGVENCWIPSRRLTHEVVIMSCTTHLHTQSLRRSPMYISLADSWLRMLENHSHIAHQEQGAPYLQTVISLPKSPAMPATSYMAHNNYENHQSWRSHQPQIRRKPYHQTKKVDHQFTRAMRTLDSQSI